MAAVAEDVPNCERDNGIEAEAEAEYATLYFRVYAIPKTQIDWFAIPPRGVNVGTDGCICPVFKEPPGKPFTESRPYTLGPYLFILTEGDQPQSGNYMKKFVYYLDMRNIEAGWIETHSFTGSFRHHIFVANDKIYILQFSENTNKFILNYLDCHNLEKGWQYKLPKGHDCSVIFDNIVFASMLEYEATTDSTQVKPRARCALFFTDDYRISYNFKTNKIVVSKELLLKFWGCYECEGQGVFLDDTVYVLCASYISKDIKIVAYNHRDHKWCPTPLIGLEKCDNAFPIRYPYKDVLPARLLHLGKRRLCLVWHCPFPEPSRVFCTKFDVHVNEGQHYAENVSTQVYKIAGGYGDRQFEAL